MQNNGFNPNAQQYMQMLQYLQSLKQQQAQKQQPSQMMQLAGKGANMGGKYIGKQAYNTIADYFSPTETFTGAGSLDYGLPAAGGDFMGMGGAVPEGYGVLAPTGTAPTAGAGIMANAASMGALPLAGIAAGVGLGAKGLKDLFSGKETKGIEGWGGRATLGIATGGFSEVARLAGLGRKSTKDYQKERWGKATKGDTNTGWADFYGKNKEGSQATPEGITRGADGSWVKSDGSWDPREYAGVLGNAETFGNDWFKLDEAKRDSLVTQYKNENLYVDDNGDKRIKDQARARELFNQVMSGQAPAWTQSKDKPAIMGGSVQQGLAQALGAQPMGNYNFGHLDQQYQNLSKDQKNAYWASKK